MDLSKLSIEPRVRNGWQAIDLGFAMARRWWWPCFLVWAIPATVLYLALSIAFSERAWLAIAIVWWLKPLWDRLPLVLASRALFSEPLDVKATLRNLGRLFKTDAFAAITWRRFSPSRSFDLPVTVLEGLRGQQRAKRLAVLHQSYANAASGLTILLMHVEFFISLAIWSTVALLVPREFQVDWMGIMLSEDTVVAHISNFTALLAMVVVAPFYCLSGFAMYICRRVQLEGWDIEIRFRHLAEGQRKRESGKMGKVAVSLLPVLLSLALLLPTPNSWAQVAEEQTSELLEAYYGKLNDHTAAAEAKAAIIAVMGGPDFHRVEMESGWRLKRPENASDQDPRWIYKLIEFLRSWSKKSEPLREGLTAFASGFELLVWALLIALVTFLIYRYRQGLMKVFGYRPRLSSRRQQPEVMFGLDVREESLPQDVVEEVLRLWNEGSQREALGLLYRATLSRLIHQFSFEFYAGFTEQECVAVVRRGDNETLSEYMARLTRSWQQLAYAHRVPDESQVQGLCAGWEDLFGESRHAA